MQLSPYLTFLVKIFSSFWQALPLFSQETDYFFSSPKLISRTTVWRTLNSGIQIDPLNFLPSLQMSKWCFDSSHLEPIQEVVGNA